MNSLKTLILVFCLATLGAAPQGGVFDVPDQKLPDGRSQREEILKAEHKKALEEAGDLIKLAEQLKAELEKDDRHVLSISTLKKTEEIEKLAKKIRGRLRR